MPPSLMFPILQKKNTFLCFLICLNILKDATKLLVSYFTKKNFFLKKHFLDPENNLNISSALCSANVTQSFRKPLSDAIATAMLLLLLLLLWPEGKSCPTFTQAMIGSEVHTTTTFLRNRK